MQTLRPTAATIRAELYLGSSGMKFGRRSKYADKRGSPIVVIQGSTSAPRAQVTLKDLIEGAKAAAAIKDNKEWKESRPAQVTVTEADLVPEVRKIFARHLNRRSPRFGSRPVGRGRETTAPYLLPDTSSPEEQREYNPRTEMAAETAKQFEALEATSQTVMSVFTKAGFEAVAPAIIQPAGVFLDVIGETLRARTYVFTDPDGDELCMRPDLTVPTCRLHLERHPSGRCRRQILLQRPCLPLSASGRGQRAPARVPPDRHRSLRRRRSRAARRARSSPPSTLRSLRRASKTTCCALATWACCARS